MDLALSSMLFIVGPRPKPFTIQCEKESPLVPRIAKKVVLADEGLSHLRGQPGASISPLPISRGAGQAEGSASLFDGQPRKDAEFDQFRRGRILLCQLFQRLIQLQQLVRSSPPRQGN